MSLVGVIVLIIKKVQGASVFLTSYTYVLLEPSFSDYSVSTCVVCM